MFRNSLFLLICTVIATGSQSLAAEEPTCDSDVERYVFSWPIRDGCDNAPRGGTSQGASVIISEKPHNGWLAIQNPKLSKFEKDRAAILAMAGGYRVDFDFLETVGFSADYKRDRPYHSWGTEFVYVVEDKPEFISLQHIMVMYFEQEEGAPSEPFVMKHWRQDWTYEDTRLLQFNHRKQWVNQPISEEESRGKWTQAVYQVDDSPRYESIGEWVHNASFSSWLSGTTRRPLPRREFSVRNDYQALEGFNRHTVTRYGWVQEEENWKLVINQEGQVDSKAPYRSKELGVARYRLAENVDFSPGDEFMLKTSEFWSYVRYHWGQVIDEDAVLSLRSSVDGQPLFMPLFSYATALLDKEVDEDEMREFVEETINRYVK